MAEVVVVMCTGEWCNVRACFSGQLVMYFAARPLPSLLFAVCMLHNLMHVEKKMAKMMVVLGPRTAIHKSQANYLAEIFCSENFGSLLITSWSLEIIYHILPVFR